MANFAGWQKHLHLARESVWGTLPAEPDYLYLPYAAYDVTVRPESTQADLFTGLRQRRHHRVTRTRLAGSLRCPLLSYHVHEKSVAQHLLEWLLSGPQSVQTDSFTAELYEAGTDNKRHLGLRTASGTISGSADAPGIELLLQLEGKTEEGGIQPPAVDPSSPTPVEFLFHDSTFTLDSVELPLRSFSVRIDNGLQVYHNNSYWPSLITAGLRDVSLEFSFFKSDDTFDLMRRLPPEHVPAQLVLKGAHNGTGPGGTTHTTVTFDFAHLGFRDLVEQGGLLELQRQQARFVALKPDTEASELTVTFDAMT